MSGPLLRFALADDGGAPHLHILVAVPGILSKPGWAFGWTDQIVTWFQQPPRLWRADKFEYFARPLTRWIGQRKRARNLADVLYAHRHSTIHLVCHSNGGDVVCRALKELRTLGQYDPHYREVRIGTIQFIASAASADFEKNGLNEALRTGQVQRVAIYQGGKDEVLNKFARWSRWAGWIVGLGYGTMGYDEPRNVDPIIGHRLAVIREPQFNHGLWFKPGIIGTTFERLFGFIHAAIHQPNN